MKQYHSKKYLANQLKKKSPLEIAKENNVSVKTIYRMKHNFDLTKRKQPSWSKRELALLSSNYPENAEVYKLFPKRTVAAINDKAYKLRISRVKRKGKYLLNDKFFDTWSVASAYVFGFLCSDGNVSRSERLISFHISKKDIEILKLIKRVMDANHSIYTGDSYAYLRLYSKRIKERVIKLGCEPRKSLTLEFPKIPDRYLNHFIRGYFDGDGSISFNKPNTIRIKLAGTRKFLSVLQNKLYLMMGLQKHRIEEYKHIASLLYYGDDARKFCSWLYGNNKDLYLKRKYNRYVKHMEIRRLNGN